MSTPRTDQPCASLSRSNPRAGELCTLLVEEIGLPAAEIDGGEEVIACTEEGCSTITRPGSRGDGISPREVTTAAARLLEEEQERFAYGDAARPASEKILGRTPFRLPTLFSSFDAKRGWDDRLLVQVRDGIQRIRREVATTGIPPVSITFNRQLVKKIVAWILDPNGLGVRPVPVSSYERGVRELLTAPREERTADCTEFARLVSALFMLAGLQGRTVDVWRIAGRSHATTHVAVEVALDADGEETLTVDLSLDAWISKEGHPGQTPMPDATAHAVFTANRAETLLMREGDADAAIVTEAGALYEEAIAEDPWHAILRYQYAHFLNDRGDREGARREACRALQLRPFDDSFSRMCRALTDDTK